MLKRNLRVAREGERASPQGKSACNRILVALPDSEFRSIRPHLEFLSLPHHRLLYEPNQKIDFLYFPNRGLISLVIVMEDGKRRRSRC
jgi:CRP-like cAMP-binding protein